MQKHEAAVNTLARDIFSRALRPGAKLPAERQLSQAMAIDRTSLRMALKQLEAMGVLDIRQGDGIYVKDYLRHAGPDFLQLVVALDDDPDHAPVVDEYMMDEMWEFWAAYFPAQLKMAAKRSTARDMKDLMELLDIQQECLHDRERVLELDLLAEDRIAQATGNMVIMLYSNASRPIRRRMIRAFYDQMDDETLRRHVEIKRVLLQEYLSGALSSDEIAGNYGKVLEAHRQAIKRKWNKSSKAAQMVESYKDAMAEAGGVKA